LDEDVLVAKMNWGRVLSVIQRVYFISRTTIRMTFKGLYAGRLYTPVLAVHGLIVYPVRWATTYVCGHTCAERGAAIVLLLVMLDASGGGGVECLEGQIQNEQRKENNNRSSNRPEEQQQPGERQQHEHPASSGSNTSTSSNTSTINTRPNRQSCPPTGLKLLTFYPRLLFVPVFLEGLESTVCSSTYWRATTPALSTASYVGV
jgi:hypothetical protein